MTLTEYVYEPRGAALELFYDRSPELLIAGPAGTGKSRAALEKLHLCAMKYAGMRGLICRKTRTSLTQAGLVTYETQVLPPLQLQRRSEEQEYRYPNRSVIVVGGLDKEAVRIFSTEYDMVFVQEATELEENDWETITTRLRNGVMPYQQLIADCNPSTPTHWLKRRADSGQTTMLESRHEDNPVLYDNGWTDAGAEYIAKLDALSGVRLQRLRHGRWAAAEGLIYEEFDSTVHVITLPEFEEKTCPAGIPESWPRYWCVDFGSRLGETAASTHPFVWQAWAQDPEGRLILYHELYRVEQLVRDMAARIKEVTKGEPRPHAVVCDHDAENRMQLERDLGVSTIGARKAVLAGIDLVKKRLTDKALAFLPTAFDRDPLLDDARQPCSSLEEIDGYVWNDRTTKEQPRKERDHGMDAMRYMVAHLDLRGGPVTVSDDDIWS